ncbi:helicase-related protein [Promethearchaeum syntrophicum]|uniref:Helicase-related protein n=1 Tax=Promethearchaeum syntrophicum TaxID=2594042 RepID=A0A5B9DCS6_9ARCH|nr:helicase-related protein [Candidatus Prometheoarchaeum syntrophicum]
MANFMKSPHSLDKNPKFYSHPLLKKDLIEWRDYQVEISKIASNQNTLVVLPTALGKTIVALLTLVNILEKAPKSKIIMLAPTRPLVLQHYDVFQKFLKPEIKCCLFSSNLSPIKRTFALNGNQIFFSTPQIIQNDLKAGLYSLEGIGQIIFDETHKARKKYAYTFVANQYLEQNLHPLILGITASPGKDLFRINELCETLQIEQIIFRDFDSPDVKKYTFGINSIFKKIELPNEILKALLILDTAVHKIRDFMFSHEILPKRNFISKFQFIQLIQDLKLMDTLLDPYTTDEDLERYGLTSNYGRMNFPHLLDMFDKKKNDKIPNKSRILNQAINGIYLEHLKELLTTQDIRMFRNYLQKLEERALEGNKRIKRLLNSKYILGAQNLLNPIKKSPKIPVLLEILKNEFLENPNAKIIIFTQYREMAKFLIKELNDFSTNSCQIRAKRFVGQATKANDKGLNQKDQKSMITDFSTNQFNVLVATSVAEEGLDIPSVNSVVFYESIPSEIRLIQRRGRTGRHQIGKCYFLVQSNSLDEIYSFVSHRREEKMHELLKHPKYINTVPKIKRSDKLPEYKFKKLEHIKENYRKIKENHGVNSVKKIETLISQNSDKKKSSGYELIQDITENLTLESKKRIELSKSNKTKGKEKLFLTKKTFTWLISTMGCIGSIRGTKLYCDLDDLYLAAKEEEMDIIKIEKEIQNGITKKMFEKTNNFLISTPIS